MYRDGQTVQLHEILERIHLDCVWEMEAKTRTAWKNMSKICSTLGWEGRYGLGMLSKRDA